MLGKNATEMELAGTAGIAEAASVLEAGGLVAVPTETVYGLAARADNAEAVAKIYAAKGRPDFNPLIVHVTGAEQAARLAHIGDAAADLMAEHWPGPLTLVLPKREGAGLAPAITAGLPSVAVRAPAHPVMRALLEACDFPLAAPSANRSGFISPTSAGHVMETLNGRIDMVLDGGSCSAGLESTIAAVRESGAIEILRPGPIVLEGSAEPNSDDTPIEAPGQLSSHYSPGKPVRLNADTAEADEFHIGFGGIAGEC
ncbi:MAG: L-threonylcarbamoyladenylate synthase, partial [Marinomonas sp.]